MGLCFGNKPCCYSKSSVNDNNSSGGENKSQSDNLWPFVGHFLKDHKKQEAVGPWQSLNVVVHEFTREKRPHEAHVFQDLNLKVDIIVVRKKVLKL